MFVLHLLKAVKSKAPSNYRHKGEIVANRGKGDLRTYHCDPGQSIWEAILIPIIPSGQSPIWVV